MIRLYPNSESFRLSEVKHRIHEKVISKLIGNKEKGFNPLILIHEERMSPGIGFPLKNLPNSECVRIILKGAMAHQDVMGNRCIQNQESVVLISTNPKVLCQAYNASDREEVHFIEVWMHSLKDNLPYHFQTHHFDGKDFEDLFVEFASSNENAPLRLNQNASINYSELNIGKSLNYKISSNQYIWLQVLEGLIHVNEDSTLHVGDAAAISQEESLSILGEKFSKILLIDL